MRAVVAVMVGLIGGFVSGIALSEIIGLIGLLTVHHPIGIRFLSIYLAILGAAVAVIVDNRRTSR